MQTADSAWPEDVAAIYQQLAEDDCRVAAEMFAIVRETWPADEEAPFHP